MARQEVIDTGTLVSFCPIDAHVELVFAEGIKTRLLSDKLTPGTGYFPRPGEIGLVVGGPDFSVGGQFIMWEVYVGGSNWWFTEDHLVAKE